MYITAEWLKYHYSRRGAAAAAANGAARV